MSFRKTALVVALALLGPLSCAGKKPEHFKDDKPLYEYATKLFQDEQYSEAIPFFESLRNRFPNSPYATESELKIADAHFQKDDFAEAEVAYQTFRSLHPTHPKLPHVLLRTALTHYERIPGGPDRDQTETSKALDLFRELTSRFSDSKEAGEAQKYVQKCKRSLVEQEMYVADFYLDRKEYEAALLRLESVRQNKDFKDLRSEAGYKLGLAHFKLANTEQARKILEDVAEDGHSGTYQKRAKELLARLPSTSSTSQ